MSAGKLMNIAVLLLAVHCAAQAGAATVGNGEPGVLTPEALVVLGAELEALDMMGDFDQQGNLLLAAGNRLRLWYGRALPAVEATAPTLQPGVRRHPLSRAGIDDYVLVFDDELGRRMQQPLVPMPVDWNGLQASLLAFPGVSAAMLDEESGDISVDVDGRRVNGRLSYLANTSIVDFPLLKVYVTWAGDLNGDGTGDYYVYYPLQSLVQFLFVYPQPR